VATLHHIHIKTGDPDGSAAWWASMFGASILPSFEIGSARFVPVELAEVRINLSRPDGATAGATGPSPAFPHYGLEHLGIRVADLDQVLARCEQQGLPIHERRRTEASLVAFVSSPEGVLLELLQPLT
jgi:catechol 2,3-dioxygenase-like lactoylglutathione lyase family enzyme